MRGIHRHHERCGRPGHQDCGCGFHRRFLTREERIARLEEYLKELQAEVQAVQEVLAELKAAR